MGQSNPGFAGFMGNVMGQQDSSVPPPMQTRAEPSGFRPGNNNSSRPVYTPSFQNQNDGINIRENFSSASDIPKSSRQPRAEMKGPSDISDILSGLKTKTINIQQAPPQQQQQEQNINDSSTISISELKELQSEGNIPKKSKRRQKSDKNTLSLDI
jgi:hypothetical protein